MQGFCKELQPFLCYLTMSTLCVFYKLQRLKIAPFVLSVRWNSIYGLLYCDV